jgi:hypothetical protein
MLTLAEDAQLEGRVTSREEALELVRRETRDERREMRDER